MADKFEVGEVAIYFRPGSKRHGKECVIAHPAEVRQFYDGLMGKWSEAVCYGVHFDDEDTGRHVAEPHELRKKKPPRREIDRVVSWEDCAWRPSGVVA